MKVFILFLLVSIVAAKEIQRIQGGTIQESGPYYGSLVPNPFRTLLIPGLIRELIELSNIQAFWASNTQLLYFTQIMNLFSPAIIQGQRILVLDGHGSRAGFASMRQRHFSAQSIS